MRRRVLIGVVLAALLAVPAAGSALRPVKRDFGELSFPRVRAGTIEVPRAHRIGRIRVIATLPLAPLARAQAPSVFGLAAKRKLNVHSASSREYLARIDAAQAKAIAQLKRAIPSARVTRRYRIVLDGFVVSLPVRTLPKLVRQAYLERVYPSLTYTLSLNRSPAVIGADVFHTRTSQNGEGVKIGVVDDGVDNTNPFLSGDGYTLPAGFPLGDTRFTNNKVIVARAFPGPGAETEPGGRLPLDRMFSFHATHVSGIAAGNAGTCSPGGADHPMTCGLSGVAPRAYIGNYRVFNVPTPIGHIAESPEIAAAFEQAVADGMDVINFSGGGPESEPQNDVLIAAVNNVAAAGVVPVISAGNDRDEFGTGTVGSPGTAPGAISVAAASNSQVFAPSLVAIDAGREVLHAPIATGASSTPPGWVTNEQVLTDVGSIVGRSGAPVDRLLCGAPGDPNGPGNDLPAGSLNGQIALVSRGSCTFVSKAGRVQQAGGIGMVLVNNRSGETSGLPLQLPVPAAMISDADGAALRAALSGGRINVRIGVASEDIVTNRSGIVTFFSASGPTAMNHLLKPDVAAPGGQILSSTLPEFSGGSPFAVFDGTSMAAPHASGAAALLVQRHPTWTPQQVKSALISTAGPAWADTARTREAPVTLEGGGLINVNNADDPQVFTMPASLSFGDLNVNHGEQSSSLLVRVTDAGGGAGDWTVSLASQAQTTGVTVTVPALVSLAPGGEVQLPVVARAAADAQAGDQMGFVVLRKGTVTRRIPYYFFVERPALESLQAQELTELVQGDTVRGVSKVSQYRFPGSPFGPPPSYTGAPMNEAGAETLYTTTLAVPAINFGVSVLAQSENSIIDPWVLGSPDENDVEGYAGTPVNVNPLMFDYRANLEAAATVFPLAKRYYVAVDSGTDTFNGVSLPGQYILRAWIDDLRPPQIKLLTARVASGRPTLVLRVTDLQAGVDPLSLVIAYNRVLLGASAYDPLSGLAVFGVPQQAPQLTKAKTDATLSASDFQEAKNVNTIGQNILPNTAFNDVKINVVKGPALTWLAPEGTTCLRKTVRLLVVASSTKPVRSVSFFDGKKRIALKKTGAVGLFFFDWKTGKVKKGKHTLKATARDSAGKTYTSMRNVRVCK